MSVLCTVLEFSGDFTILVILYLLLGFVYYVYDV